MHRIDILPKTVYVTIDDTPSPDLQPKLDPLREREIPAVLFSVGTNLDARPELALYAMQHGFIIGNHSYSHPSFSDLTVEQCCEEIRRTDAIIEALYTQAAVECPAKFFCFPYGDKGGLLDDVDGHWTYDGMDWALTVDDPPFGITSLGAILARMDEMNQKRHAA